MPYRLPEDYGQREAAEGRLMLMAVCIAILIALALIYEAPKPTDNCGKDPHHGF